MRLHRRLLLGALATPFATGLQPALAAALYPARPIRIIVPVAVGGVTDVVARIYAEHFQATLGQPVVIENQAGAGSTIGAAAAGRAAPDGYTVLIGTNNHAVMRVIQPGFPFDPVADYVPLALLGRQPFALVVNPGVPARTVPELLGWLRERHGEANYGTSAPGATSHQAGELLRQLARVDWTLVPYRSAPAAVSDLVAGRVDLTIDTQTLLAPLIRDNRLRGLAVTTTTRSRLLPELPTLQEAGVPGYDCAAWQMLFGLRGTPPEVLARLAQAARQAVTDPAVQQRLAAVGVETYAEFGPTAAAAHLRREVARWSPIVAAMALTP